MNGFIFNKETIQKILRCAIVALCFVGLLTIIGIPEREVHQIGMMIGVMAVFGLLLRNIWITLFLWWSLFLFSYGMFETGQIYITNIFYGCLLYYVTRLAFAKKHINFFINGVLWFAAINCFYMLFQMNGLDFIYSINSGSVANPLPIRNLHPVGFMNNSGYTACLIAMSIPLLASRWTKWSIIGSLCLFVPLYIQGSTIGLIAAVIGLLFVMWFRIRKLLWIIIVIALMFGGSRYLVKSHYRGLIGWHRVELWRTVMAYTVKHPVLGWGLDSYRNTTKEKDFLFYDSFHLEGEKKLKIIKYWDNPHNLLVSLVFEFGIIPIFFLGGYLRQCAIRFNRSVKEANTIALGSLLLVVVLLSMAQFPMFLARLVVIIIPALALFEVQTNN